MSRIDSSNAFRLQGEAVSIAELAKTKPGLIVPADDPRVEKFNARMTEVQARLRADMPEAFAARVASENPGHTSEPAATPAQPEVNAATRETAAVNLEWELARSRMAFDELLKK